MPNNYLITGYWGEPHVTAENDRGINAGIFGKGRFVLPVGEQFKAEYIGNNTVRVYDGKLMNNGAAGGIPAGEYVDLLISGASQGMKRNDLIVFQYSQDASTMVEKGTFEVVQGAETSGTAVDPELTQADLLSGKATFDQMALWRVPVTGATISAPVQMFSVSKSLAGADNGNKTIKTTATIGTSWTGSAAPYTQSISISGVTADNVVEISLPSTATAAQVEAYQALNLQDGGQAAGSITLRAFGDVNTVSIPINVVIRGDL